MDHTLRPRNTLAAFGYLTQPTWMRPWRGDAKPSSPAAHRSRTREGKREPTVSRRDETMQLEWVTDAAFRFFSTQPDELFGYVLHPVDLATNKASSAADRRVPRDIHGLNRRHN